MKLAVVGGAGLLGSTTAFYAGVSGALSEIKLVDVKENLVTSHTMDMEHALCSISNTKITLSDYKGIADSDIILFAASLPERQVASRNEFLRDNLSLVSNVCEEMKQYYHGQIVLCCTNPTDVFNYVLYKKLGWERSKFIGFCLNDTLRMKWSLQKTLGLDFARIGALCVGEHGEGQVPLYSKATYDNKPLDLRPDQITSAKKLIIEWFSHYQALDSGRSTGWTSAVTLTRIITAIVKGGKEAIPCSAIVDGEYGETNVSIGVPCVLGPSGVEKIMSVDLDQEEASQFAAAAKKIRGFIASTGY